MPVQHGPGQLGLGGDVVQAGGGEQARGGEPQPVLGQRIGELPVEA
ncbi:hypothetical protein [Nonomuraea gerenzanensis]|nr:hypothetical protein [Nonomuraea gerenzanensis]UBU14906.1 hypothetical protein LCN96_07755 [Nonomuraea gerenzanensis]